MLTIQNYRWRVEMHNMIGGFKQKINELKHHCSKLYKKNGKLKRIIDNSKPKCLISKKKRMHKTRKNKKYEKYQIFYNAIKRYVYYPLYLFIKFF